MKLSRVVINNFRSFGESQEIKINDQTVLIGNNSSGKTTVLQALSKLFSDKQVDRIIRKRDFHLPRGLRPGQNNKELFIETIFEFDELEGDSYGRAIPTFFEHFTVSGNSGRPVLRIRLESSWQDDGTVEGSIDTQIYYIKSSEENFREEDKYRAPRRDLDKIRLLYVPASRNPEKELGNASGSILSRIVNSINWTEKEIEDITGKIDDLNNAFLYEDGPLTQINQEIQKSWELYHENKRYAKAELTINSSEMVAALRQIALIFSPTTTEEAFTVSDLGDGLRSIFYFSLVNSMLDIELEITKDHETNPNNPRFKLTPPILTILAIEEPENHIAPHHIGKLVKRFELLSKIYNSQVILTSHSPSIVKRIEPEDLRYLRVKNSDKSVQSTVSEIKLPKDSEESYKYIKGAVKAYPELYFSKLVILGEGDSEELLLPKFFDLLGIDIDSSQISVVPLGGRHVNYFWKLLKELGVPYITLLDFDNERSGGGWGRVHYAIKQLQEIGFNCSGLVGGEDIDSMSSWPATNIESEKLTTLLNELEKFNIFFSSSLDIDFLMLQSYKSHYLNTIPQERGPVFSYEDLDGKKKTKNITCADRANEKELNGLKKRVNQAVRATLKDKSGPGDSFSEEEKELMIWYQYLFLGRGKPSTHMQFLLSTSDDELKRGVPTVFKKIVKRAEELLGE